MFNTAGHPYESAVAVEIGLDATLELPESCADFYLLERLTSTDDGRAARRLDKLERRLSKEFSVFIETAVGGELRFTPRAVDHDCSCDPEDYYSCPCCEGECYHEGMPLPSDLAELEDFLYDCSNKSSRAGAWQAWIDFMKTHDRLTSLRLAVEAFDRLDWDGGYGGGNWKTVTQVVLDFYEDRINRRTFVDRCWTLEHNGGNIFNKLYKGMKLLNKILVFQANNEYDRLTYVASEGVERLWKNQRLRDYSEYDETWLGTQLTDDREDV